MLRYYTASRYHAVVVFFSFFFFFNKRLEKKSVSRSIDSSFIEPSCPFSFLSPIVNPESDVSNLPRCEFLHFKHRAIVYTWISLFLSLFFFFFSSWSLNEKRASNQMGNSLSARSMILIASSHARLWQAVCVFNVASSFGLQWRFIMLLRYAGLTHWVSPSVRGRVLKCWYHWALKGIMLCTLCYVSLLCSRLVVIISAVVHEEQFNFTRTNAGTTNEYVAHETRIGKVDIKIE